MHRGLCSDLKQLGKESEKHPVGASHSRVDTVASYVSNLPHTETESPC